MMVSAEEEYMSTYLVPKSYNLSQVVVKSPLIHYNQLSMPSNIAILNKEALLRSDQSSFISSLNNISGVYAHEGTNNTSRITIRGLGARSPYATNRLKAYFNEIPLSSGDGTTLVEDIDPSFIQSISLIKGAKSAMYGHGIGGVLLMNGKHIYRKEKVLDLIFRNGGIRVF
jgi:iron complex outermembrane receptor protein